ncbi:TonB-dependent receptor [Pedobacter glucosidilyticus]|uniref:TonB-dependent receptor n=1 Tax=Pedobacter glucosidilyticus TaxID=1122941 RepID=UPI00040E819C|nr:TonB-dependent receptor [Pedobacter glucosidilyticus]
MNKSKILQINQKSGSGKFLAIIKIAILLIIHSTIVFASDTLAKDIKFNIKVHNATLIKVLSEVEKATDYGFLIKTDQLNLNKKYSLDLKNVDIEQVLNKVLDRTLFTYTIIDNNIVISKVLPANLNKPVIKSINIKGKVLDDTGLPLPGVSVSVKGTTNATLTDVNGNYSINNVAEDAVLRFSFLGMTTQEIPVEGKSIINITLKQESIATEEVVVVAYGTQRKETLTGSISTLKGTEILNTRSPNLIQNVQGKISGVQIRQSSSQPGGGQTSINIRGFGTPLIVIDGVIRDGVGEFERLDPNDIESISVLKDGSAAIYGIGASNGVILVTTKKGSSGPVKVNYSNNLGFSSPTSIPKAVNSADWVDLRNELGANIWLGPTNTREETQKYKDGVEPGYESVDWYNETMKPSAIQQQHNLSLRGGSENIKYFVSTGYTKDNGLVRENPLNFQQFNFRANSDIKLAKSLDLNINLFGRRDLNNQIAGGFTSILSGVYGAVPYQKPYINDDPNFPAAIVAGTTNPVALIRPDLTGYNDTKTNLLRSSISLNYKIPGVKGLEARIFGAFDLNNSSNKFLSRQIKLYRLDPVTQETVQASTYSSDAISFNLPSSQRLNLQSQLNYKASFNNKHNISSMFLHELRTIDSQSIFARRDIDFFTVDVLAQGSLINQTNDGNELQQRYESFIGRFNYDFKQKYLAEFVFRQDGSFRYGPNQRWGFFPGVMLAWRVSEEGFIKNNLSFLQNMKLRVSYGETGEDVGQPFQYVAGYQTGSSLGYEFVDGVYKTLVQAPLLVNNNLSWSRSKILNAGIDLELFKNGLFGLTFDVYRRNREGLLATRAGSLPNTFGASLPQENLNSDRVQGFDFTINHRNKIGEFSYGISANMNISQSMNLYREQNPFQSSYSKWKNDQSYRNKNIIWGYDVIGRFQNWEEIRNYPVFMDGTTGNISQLPGDPIYRDVNGDGLITTDDMLPMFRGGQVLASGSSSPDYTSGQPPVQFGFNFNGSYKGFDFNVLVQGAANYTINLGNEWQTPLFSDRNAPQYLMDRWRLADYYDKDSEWVPGYFPATRRPLDAPTIRLTNNIYRRNASYVRLKNIEIGYTIPKKLLNQVKIDNLRIHANATNIYTRTDRILKLFDPERGEGDFGSNYAYPLIKSINLGLNVTF